MNLSSQRKHIFIGGLHRSGTSLLHSILREHPSISGFENTGVPEDEGQHLQNVYPPAYVFGGIGAFGQHPQAAMTERHPLANPKDAARLWSQWKKHWDLSKEYLLEKTPANIIRLRYLQSIFPQSKFVILLRHPTVVAAASMKFTGGKKSLFDLIEHNLHVYDILHKDIPYIKDIQVIRYEDFVEKPDLYLKVLYKWLDIPNFDTDIVIKIDINRRYLEFLGGSNDIKDPHNLRFLDRRASTFGYSISHPQNYSPFKLPTKPSS
jgi:Sulfotransferase family